MLSDYSPSRQTKNPKPADYESEAVGLKVRGRRTKRDYSMKYLRKIEEIEMFLPWSLRPLQTLIYRTFEAREGE